MPRTFPVKFFHFKEGAMPAGVRFRRAGVEDVALRSLAAELLKQNPNLADDAPLFLPSSREPPTAGYVFGRSRAGDTPPNTRRQNIPARELVSVELEEAMAPILPPDHFPLASPLDAMKTVPWAAFVLSLTLYDMSLVILPSLHTVDEPQQADDPPTPDHSPAPYRVQEVGTIGGSSSNDLNVNLREDLRLSDDDLDGLVPMNLALKLSSSLGR